MKFEFKQIDDNHQRAKVPGGWLVKAFEVVCHFDTHISPITDNYDWRVTMTFVPDPKHEWEIENVPQLYDKRVKNNKKRY